jgi:acetyl-CoA carboxylase biotin carboxyl carrier protein
MTEPGADAAITIHTSEALDPDASPAGAAVEPTAVASDLPVAPGADALQPNGSVPAGPANGGDASLLGLVDRLAAILERSDLLELEVEAGGTGLVLRKPEALPSASAAPPPAAVPVPGAAPTPGASATPETAGRPSVKAPLTGIWYSAPAPGTAPFVEVGREVAVGQVIGLIEAMKLFNEIKSDLAGRVVKVAAENGQLVKAKQSLIEVEPL